MNWLTPELRMEIRNVFEPRYKRKLKDSEIEVIAENLTGTMETISKFKWRQDYENISR